MNWQDELHHSHKPPPSKRSIFCRHVWKQRSFLERCAVFCTPVICTESAYCITGWTVIVSSNQWPSVPYVTFTVAERRGHGDEGADGFSRQGAATETPLSLSVVLKSQTSRSNVAHTERLERQDALEKTWKNDLKAWSISQGFFWPKSQILSPSTNNPWVFIKSNHTRHSGTQTYHIHYTSDTNGLHYFILCSSYHLEDSTVGVRMKYIKQGILNELQCCA